MKYTHIENPSAAAAVGSFKLNFSGVFMRFSKASNIWIEFGINHVTTMHGSNEATNCGKYTSREENNSQSGIVSMTWAMLNAPSKVSARKNTHATVTDKNVITILTAALEINGFPRFADKTRTA